MSALDFIKIRGLDGEQGDDTGDFFEVFQGLGANIAVEGASALADALSESASTLSETPISSDPDLAEGIWQGQNAKLESEIDYCGQLQTQLKKKEQSVNGWRDKLVDVVQEILGEWLGELVALAVTASYGPVAGFIAGVATELGIEWGLDALLLLLTRGNELLDGIKAENAQLLEIEKSRENYEYREQVLARHREDIKLILEQIRSAEQSVNIKDDLQIREMIDELIALQYNQEELRLPDGAHISLRGRYHGG